MDCIWSFWEYIRKITFKCTTGRSNPYTILIICNSPSVWNCSIALLAFSPKYPCTIFFIFSSSSSFSYMIFVVNFFLCGQSFLLFIIGTSQLIISPTASLTSFSTSFFNLLPNNIAIVATIGADC